MNVTYTPACLRPLATLALLITIQSTGIAGQPQPKGFIATDSGKHCSYTQTTQNGVKYFHELPGTHSTLTFDDPACMKDTGLGLDINKMMVNNTLARWYSHQDAAFKTTVSNTYRTSPLQVRGQCIQSAKYPSIGIAIEYVVANHSITQVKHAATVGACQK